MKTNSANDFGSLTSSFWAKITYKNHKDVLIQRNVEKMKKKSASYQPAMNKVEFYKNIFSLPLKHQI